MKRPKVFRDDEMDPIMTAEFVALLEEIALGEAELEEATAVVAQAVSLLDDETAPRLYESLRSWVWKALDARRRDGELLDWLDVLGRVSSSLTSVNRDLAIKLEACAELLHTSVTRASALAEGLFERKHVRNVVRTLLRAGGSVRKRELLTATGLKQANLARIIAPLRDAGWVERSMDGKEAIYRLTEAGRKASPVELHTDETPVVHHWPERLLQSYLVVATTRTREDHRWTNTAQAARNRLQIERDKALPLNLQYIDLVGRDHIKLSDQSWRHRPSPDWAQHVRTDDFEGFVIEPTARALEKQR